MPILGKLKALNVVREKRPGLYGDGGRLYLQVTKRGAKSWIFRFWVAQRDAATGRTHSRSDNKQSQRSYPRDGARIARYRVAVRSARSRARVPQAPGERHRSDRGARAWKAAGCSGAGAILEIQGCCGSIHSVAWSRLEKREARRAVVGNAGAYAYPQIGDLSIQTIDTTLVMKVVEPIWLTKPETASRLRGRIESVLDWATVRGYRQGENPARWRGRLDKLLPARSKVRKAQHHSAIPFAELSSAHLSIMGPCSLSRFA